MVNRLADFLLRLLDREPSGYPLPSDKWAIIVAEITEIAIPYILVFLFFIPLLVVWWRNKRKGRKFTDLSIYTIVVALIIGALLSWGGWWLNQWSYGYGQGVIFREIYGDSITDF